VQNRSKRTYAELDRLLMALDFQVAQSEGRCKTYWHQPSDTVILLPAERPRTAVREADLASVRIHLAGRGVLDEIAFAEFVRTGMLPLGSPS
jgi:hypothetical protein